MRYQKQFVPQRNAIYLNCHIMKIYNEQLKNLLLDLYKIKWLHILQKISVITEPFTTSITLYTFSLHAYNILFNWISISNFPIVHMSIIRYWLKVTIHSFCLYNKIIIINKFFFQKPSLDLSAKKAKKCSKYWINWCNDNFNLQQLFILQSFCI